MFLLYNLISADYPAASLNRPYATVQQCDACGN